MFGPLSPARMLASGWEQISHRGLRLPMSVPMLPLVGAGVEVEENGGAPCAPHGGTSPYVSSVFGPHSKMPVSPATRFTCPRVDWPKTVPKNLSLIAKC